MLKGLLKFLEHRRTSRIPFTIIHYSWHPQQGFDSLEKILMLGKIEGKMRRGQQRMRWLGWHHQLNGHEVEQTPGDSGGQRSLVCSAGHDLATEF